MPFNVADLSDEVVRIYAEAELQLVRLLTNRISRGIDEPMWAVRRLAEVREIEANAASVARRLATEGNGAVLRAVTEAYERGDIEAVQALTGNVRPSTATSQAVTALVRDATTKLQATHLAVLRQTDDVYRAVVMEASAPSVVGTETRKQVAQRALSNFATRGITGFRDTAGRNWDLASYTEMATRSTTMRAAIEGHSDRLRANGHDLVIVSASFESCPMCDPWEGKVLSQSGRSTEYPSLNEARSSGLFHPNCEHSLGVYIPGETKPLEPDKPKEERQEKYQATQEQRNIERHIRQWKRKEAASFTDQAKRQSKQKVSDWQARQRKHVERWGLPRKYGRESLASAR